MLGAQAPPFFLNGPDSCVHAHMISANSVLVIYGQASESPLGRKNMHQLQRAESHYNACLLLQGAAHSIHAC